MKIKDIATNVYQRDNLWFSANNKDISYPETGNQNCFQIEDNSFWFIHRNNCLAEVIRSFSPEDIFFDIGGGNGFVSKRLEDEGIETILVEPGIAGALNAQKRGLKHIICSTFEGAGIRPNFVKAAGLFDVVEHIDDDVAFMSSIHKILADDGLVYITVPSFEFLWSGDDDDAGHFRRYSLKQLKNLMEKTGFKVEYATYFFSILPIPVFLFRTIPHLLGLDKNTNRLDKHRKEHANDRGFITSILNKIWKIELSKIKQHTQIPIGGSCLMVARKIIK